MNKDYHRRGGIASQSMMALVVLIGVAMMLTVLWFMKPWEYVPALINVISHF